MGFSQWVQIKTKGRKTITPIYYNPNSLNRTIALYKDIYFTPNC